MSGESILFSLKEGVQEYAQIIRDVVDADVDIADKNLIRIGGTGRFARNISQPFVTEGNAFKWVMVNKKPLFIESARCNEICVGCRNLENCGDNCELCCPILYKNEAVGVISIGSANPGQKARIMENLEQYRAFLEKIADLISAKTGEYVLYREQSYMLDLLENLISLINDGVMVLDERRQVLYINKKTENVLGVNLAQIKYLHKIGQFSVHSVLSPAKSGAEYFVKVKDRRVNLIGNIFPLSLHEKIKVFIFQDVVTMQKTLYQVSDIRNCSFSSIVGNNNRFAAVKEQGRMLAVTGAHILITGEPGTGKELFARAIHNESALHHKPFLMLSCNTASPVLERELFGRAGAGEETKLPGRSVMELAEGGTLYLEEIDRLEYYLQHQLLAAMESGGFGVRIIASSTCDLERMAKSGEFYPELYYAIASFSLQIPPLRARHSDILLLCDYYVRRTNRLLGKDVSLGEDLLELLLSYSWPGNTRELESVIDSIICTSAGSGALSVGDLPETMRARLSENMDTRFNLERMEKQMIIEALNAFSNVPNAKDSVARALGISRATLYRKLREYGITEKVLYALEGKLGQVPPSLMAKLEERSQEERKRS